MKKSNKKLFKKNNSKNPEVKAPETMTRLAWKRFRRHPGAMIGAAVLFLLILSISFASLSSYDPVRRDIENSYR